MKLIVFDWDGTLADSVSKIVQCKQFLAQKNHLPLPTDDDIQQVVGMKFEEAMRICFPTAAPDLLLTLCAEFHVLMQKKQYQAELFSGAKEVLTNFKQEGYKLAIATSKNPVELCSALHFHKLDYVFDVICCGADYKNKPDPAMLNHMKVLFDFDESEVLMVGDTSIDIEFAKNAHVKVVAVIFGAHSRNKLELANPDFLLDDLKSLPELVSGLCPSTKVFF